LKQFTGLGLISRDFAAMSVSHRSNREIGSLRERKARFQSDLVDCIRLVRRTAMQTAVCMITTCVMLALLAGIAIKLKIFGGGH
jgi:hypothetical protein